MFNGLRTEVPQKNDTATITLTDIPSPPGQRMANADVRINPPGLVSDNPDWVTILSWQGGLSNERGLVVDRLERVGPPALPLDAPGADLGPVEDPAARAGRHADGWCPDLPA